MLFEFSETLSLDDFRRGMRLHYRKLKWIIYVIGVAIFVSLGPSAVNDSELIRAILFVVGAILLYLFLLFEIVIPYFFCPYQYRQSNLVKGNFTVRLDDEWLSIRSPDIETKMRWKVYKGYKEDRHAFILYPASNMFQLIPKRFLTENQIHVLQHFLRLRSAPPREMVTALLDGSNDSAASPFVVSKDDSDRTQFHEKSN
jgi:hypothetical protein